ncbi:hypothetical protein TIFTF001_034519 [Ficus carica]|uniref:PGG domain-containing protein n=1 Tax=Ficus carica TaxID=3494 RepID=A0AA88J8Y2_FICCA|nr:hypothetical protein TIFTF001_034519 [Ficus carica]
MDEDEVALQDCNGNTAFSLAVASGSLEVAMILMQKNAQLPLFRGGQGQTPLYIAALFGYAEIAWFLYPLTKATLDQKEWIWIFFTCIHSDLYGLGLKMFEDDSALAMARDVNDDTALHILARKPLAFLQQSSESVALKLTRGLWKEILMQLPDFNVKQLIDNPTRVLFEAAEVGNFPFLVELIHSYPDLVWKVDDKNRTIFHVAVLNRHANIFNLIHEIGYAKHAIVTFKDNEDNNMLHLAATLPPQHRQNAELGGTWNLHHELVWFEAVKKIMQPSYAELKNSNGFTPQDVFTITHASLFKDGERWMKDTAKFGMLVSILITIGVFLASFHAVNGEEKILVLSHVLNVSVLVTLASSSISTLMFLSILTSNYEKMNFLYVLPFKLITGLVTLFIAMSTMMVAFNGRLFISLPHGLKWVATLTFTGTFIPVALFVLVQHYQLLSNMWDSTFVSKLLSGKGKYHAFHRKTNASLYTESHDACDGSSFHVL